MNERVIITDVDGDTISLRTLTTCVVIMVSDDNATNRAAVALERNQLLELKKAVDAAYKEIDT